MVYIFLPVGIILVFISFYILYTAYNQVKEGFENSATQNALESIYRKISDILCPGLMEVRKKMREDPDIENIDEYIQDEANGDVMYCPALTKQQLFYMSPNIGEQMVRTTVFLEKTMSELMDKINDSLNESCKQAKNQEGFADVSGNEAKAEAKAEAEAEAVVAPTDTSKVDPADLAQLKETIYGQRIASIYSALGSKAGISVKLNRVQILYTQLKDIEKNPNKLKGSC